MVKQIEKGICGFCRTLNLIYTYTDGNTYKKAPWPNC